MYTERGLPAVDGGSGTRAAPEVPELVTVDGGRGTLAAYVALVPGANGYVTFGGVGADAYVAAGSGFLRGYGGVVSVSMEDEEFEVLLSSEALSSFRTAARLYRPLVMPDVGSGMTGIRSVEGPAPCK